MARFLNERIPGVRVPEKLIDRLEKAPEPLDEGVAIAREMVGVGRSLCQGIHFMTLGHEDRIPELLG
jgi:methylenetetrahydrofolate reductase (NADPH)